MTFYSYIKFDSEVAKYIYTYIYIYIYIFIYIYIYILKLENRHSRTIPTRNKLYNQHQQRLTMHNYEKIMEILNNKREPH